MSYALRGKAPIVVPVFGYVLGIIAAEVLGSFVSVRYSLLVHLALIAALLGHYLIQENAPYRPVLLVLLLAPLLRVLSFVMPVPLLPQIFWYGLIGVPLLVSAGLIIRLLGVPWNKVGLCFGSRTSQIRIALSGLPLSIAAFIILRPEPLIREFNLPAFLLGAAILAVFTGFLEEFIFRGLIQQVTSETLGDAAAAWVSSFLFVVMYLGTLSIVYILFIAFVGVFFSFCARKTGSIAGISLAHSVMNIGLLLIWPFILGGSG